MKLTIRFTVQHNGALGQLGKKQEEMTWPEVTTPANATIPDTREASTIGAQILDQVISIFIYANRWMREDLI